MEIPVLIAGGGPVGLCASILLSRLGVPSLLVERHEETTFHPKARNLNLRTGEIVRPWGIEADLEKGSLPRDWGREFVYTRTLAGEELGRMRVGSFSDAQEALTPALPLLSSQDLIEPALRRYAESFECARVRFGCELSAFRDHGDGVHVDLASGSGRIQSVRAHYLIAADGAASGIRDALGIELDGAKGIGSFINVYFRADLSRWTDGRPAVLYWISEPGATGVFQPLDGDRRWLCQIAYDAGRESLDDYPPERCQAWVRRAIGSDEVDIDVLSVGSWTLNATVAQRLQRGRVFLAGDAAHQLPPTGGFGMNTGIQDVHNLAWKLAMVLAGHARADLLDTYDLERRPVAAYNVQRSLENAQMVGRINAAVVSGGDAAQAVGASHRYGNFLGMELGFAYGHGALVTDGTFPPEVADEVTDYVPTARPGHRAPHVMLRRGGRPISTLDLFDGRFALLAGSGGAPWCEAARTLAGDLPLEAFVVAPSGDLQDSSGRFAECYGVGSTGAVLVRPDGHVAWRSASASAHPDVELRHVLDSVLAHH